MAQREPDTTDNGGIIRCRGVLPVKGEATVYDIQVDQDESFIVGDVVVHNSQVCAVRDGLRWDINKNPIGHNIPFQAPPLHFSCRSVASIWFKPWQELGIPEEDIPARTRASMDGQVPESTTYETWLKGRSVSEQNEVLGETKAKLWREGKLSLREMVNAQGNRPLTLEELGIDE